MPQTIKKLLNNPYLSLAARLLVGVVFIYAAVGKIANPFLFAKEISNYGIMIDQSVNLMALTLPWIELIIAIFIILGIRLKASAVISTFLYIVFIIAIGIAIIKGLDINCGCFAKSASKVGFTRLLEDLGLLIVSIYIVIYPIEKLTLERIINRKKTR